jgi:hypothetical protein
VALVHLFATEAAEALVVLMELLAAHLLEPMEMVAYTVVAAALGRMLVIRGVLVREVVLGLFGPAQLAHSHQQIQGTCNGTLYSH